MVFNIHLCSKKVKEFIVFLKDFRSKFDIIWEKVNINETSNDSSGRKKRPRITNIHNDEKTSYRRLFYEILDNLSTKMEERFTEIEKLQFLGLLNNEKFQFYRDTFPDDLLK